MEYLLILMFTLLTGKFSANLMQKLMSAKALSSVTAKVRILKFDVPSVAREGGHAMLVCDAGRGVKLYTHKWYKEQMEFWRYEPKTRPQTQTFPVPGIVVDVSSSTSLLIQNKMQFMSRIIYDSQNLKSNKTHLFLKNVTSISSGNFSCEITLDNYATGLRDGHMIVRRKLL